MTLPELEALLAQPAFHQLVKVEAVAVSPDGRLTLRLPFDPAYTLFPEHGNYHGGVIATLIDVAGTMACSVLAGRPTPTANLRVDYLKSPRGCDLFADALVQRMGGQLAVADVTVRDEAGTVYAIGRGSFSVPAAKAAG
ncbi:MAG: PaaI family thioesterase [Pseudomonadota bacterium]